MKPTHFSRYLKFALFLAILCSFTNAYAYDFEVDGIYYYINDNEATVTYKGIDEYDWSSNDYCGNVIIPSTVTYNGSTYSVTSIGSAAFYACSGLTSITIPNSVTSIGGWAFTNCSGLANITIPNSITSIGIEAFYGTEWYNNQPNGIVYAGLVAYDYKGTMSSGASIIIRDGTLGIAGSAFGNLIGLASITIPNSVTTIGEEAFWGCSGLTSITIPNSVTNIGNYAFSYCWGLNEIYSLSMTPPNISSITFDDCYGATLYVPMDAVNAYKEANYWKNFTNIVGIDYVPQAGPFEVDGIYYNITSTTNRTVEVTYKDNNYGSYSGEVIIPSTITHNNRTYTVTAIGDSAFYHCYGLTAVTIPESVSAIGEGAFFGCWTDITCLAITPPSVNNSIEYGFSVFDYIYSVYEEGGMPLPVIWVPYDALDNYMNSPWYQYSLICYIGAGKTEPPTITMSIDSDNEGNGRGVSATITGVGTIYSRHEIRGLNSSWQQPYWVEQDTYYYTPSGLNISCLAVDAFAFEYGKLPSQVVTEVSDYVHSYDDIPDPDLYAIVLYDAEIDGVCYDFYESTASVSPGIVLFLMEDVPFPEDRYYIAYGHYHDESESVIIPNTVNYYGNNYVVNSIDNYAFGSTTIDYEYLSEHGVSIPYNLGDGFTGFCYLNKVVIPSTVTTIGYHAFNNCSVNYLSIPNSVINMDLTSDYAEPMWDAYEDDPNWFFIKRIHLTGEGEWSGASLAIRVNQLDISSGLTTLPELQVNPREVYCYAKVPPTCDKNTFTDYTGTLHVPESSLAAYFTAPYWCNFANIVGDAVELTDLTLNKNSAELLVDEQLTLNATIQPANANIDDITWESSNPSVAIVTSDGLVTAKSLGECDIIVTCLDKRDTCYIKVVEQVSTITLDQHRASLLPNHILTLTPTVTPEPTDLVVTSSNPSVAAARLANGKVQVVGVSVGTAIIKVASVDGNAVADSCFVNVYTEAGDVDGDGFVKIDDVTRLIDYLLSGDASSIDLGNADINYDGVVSIADVTGLIDYLLGGGASMSTRETFTVNGVSFTMIRVPAGSFMMGATEEQGSDANSWEKPVHEVTLSNSYLIGETEVTQELWLAVMGTNPSKHEGSLQKPVENVSWLDCQEFISQLNAMTGLTFRMPTEAEWEYAARGANRSRGYKYAGSNDIADVGNVSSSTTMPVGSLQPNELNIYDMSGNVDEWVWDLFGYYTSEPQIDPTGPADGGSDHMYRGGSWYGGANTARVSYRFFRASTFKRGTMGLRLAL